MEVEYCSLTSIKSDENIFATASYFTKLLLVEYNSPWSENPLISNLLPEEVNNFLLQFKKKSNSNRVLFIKNKKKANQQINIFAINNLQDLPYTNHFILKDYNQLLEFSEQDLFFIKGEKTLSDLIYLVCTNGKKDKCCSKFGVPIFKQLSQTTSNVWECTHVGGDRFAPNVVVLPYCIFYGALSIEDLPTLVELTKDQKVLLSKYRGRSCNSLIEQAAEYFLRTQQNNLNILDYKIMNCKEIVPKYFEVEIKNTKTGELKLTKIKEGKELIKRRLTCNSAKEEFPLTYQLIETDPDNRVCT
jgi:hypothetical protein